MKLCHNLFLGTVAQSMAEITILAEKSGVSRQAFLACINASVMGSLFTRYKTPAYVNLDFTPTFTATLLRKDFDLGLAAAREREVPMPVASLVHQIVQGLVGRGYGGAGLRGADRARGAVGRPRPGQRGTRRSPTAWSRGRRGEQLRGREYRGRRRRVSPWPHYPRPGAGPLPLPRPGSRGPGPDASHRS